MSEQNQKYAITVGTWPLAPGTYDPALDGEGIPDGIAIYGLFDENYTMYAEPESIPGLTRVDSISELTDNTYFVLNTSSGFDYVLAKSDEATGLMVNMVEKIPCHTETVRIYHIPNCKMVSTKLGNWGSENFKLFEEWFGKQTIFPIFSFDFLTDCDKTGGLRWMYVYDERMDVPDELEIIDFNGGYYAVISAIDGNGQSFAGAMKAREEYLTKHKLMFDDSRWELGHILTGYSMMKDILGSGQMDYWMPVKKI